ncbi:MAG: alanine racemase [Anaerolineaceae bacterium]|nr:alanine racemase [Anaerolineaceae bacterium]
MENEAYSNWLEIDLTAIQNNIKEIQRVTQKPVMAIVKANGYGHGMVPVALAAQQAGAFGCGVARIEEALALRKAGITTRILVLGYTRPNRIIEAAANNISLTVYDDETALAYAAEAEKSGFQVKVHIKFDTGMGRLGLFPEHSLPFIKQMHDLTAIDLEGIFTHFACADEPDKPTTSEQIARFEKLLQQVDSVGMRPPFIHASNSAGSIFYPQAAYDFVRAGISIYGFNPASSAPLPAGFRHGLSWKARLISIKKFPAGHGISYGHRYHTSKNERIGVIPTGYGDGYRRVEGNTVLIHGKRVRIVGSVCMDQCMINLDDIPEAQVGDEVVLIGKQDSEEITVDEIAARWNTINYEVICGLADRLPRIYLEENQQ